MIKEIVANINKDDLDILFRMDCGYIDEDIIETIESLACTYLMKCKTISNTGFTSTAFTYFIRDW
jgi:hypothetical protein